MGCHLVDREKRIHESVCRGVYYMYCVSFGVWTTWRQTTKTIACLPILSQVAHQLCWACATKDHVWQCHGKELKDKIYEVFQNINIFQIQLILFWSPIVFWGAVAEQGAGDLSGLSLDSPRIRVDCHLRRCKGSSQRLDPWIPNTGPTLFLYLLIGVIMKKNHPAIKKHRILALVFLALCLCVLS